MPNRRVFLSPVPGSTRLSDFDNSKAFFLSSSVLPLREGCLNCPNPRSVLFCSGSCGHKNPAFFFTTGLHAGDGLRPCNIFVPLFDTYTFMVNILSLLGRELFLFLFLPAQPVFFRNRCVSPSQLRLPYLRWFGSLGITTFLASPLPIFHKRFLLL